MDYGSIAYSAKEGVPQEYVLRLGSITVGAAAGNDVVLPDETVDRYHLRLICTNDGCWAVDLGSSTGVFLNQVRLQPNVRQYLRNGDTLRVGSYSVRYNGTGKPVVVPPDVAAKWPVSTIPPTARRLQGNGAPPRFRRLIPRDYGVSSYLQYLPPPYHEDDFMGRFLLIFESILEPIERTIDQRHFYFDPWFTPEDLLPWLASWVDLVLNEKWPLDRRRALLASAAELYRWRGTRRGLTDYIRIYTGFEPVITEWQPGVHEHDPGVPPPHVFRVTLEVEDPAAIDQDLLETIIKTEKPAHAGYILDVRRAADVPGPSA